MRKKRILVSPLDWGLGHATRCIPIIQSLLDQGHDVMLAGNGPSIRLLEKEFPELKTLYFPEFEIRYGKQLGLAMFKQFPHFMRLVKEERKLVKMWVQEYNLDVIISDNRYGVRCKGVKNIFITHQLYPKFPKGTSWTRTPAFLQLNSWLNKYDEIWVPDFEVEPNLSGELSHKMNERRNVKYIGPISRFEETTISDQVKWVAVLSGPEPLRAEFENEIVAGFKKTGHECVLVRGLPKEEVTPNFGENIIVHNHLDSEKLNNLLASASGVIARAGYSTIMDLWALNKPAILVPTPGQTEQEYLAQHLSKFDCWKFVEQDDILLTENVLSTTTFPKEVFARNSLLINTIRKRV